MSWRSCLDKNLEEEYEVLVVGAGITGAGIFRSLSLNGVKCLLIDKYDFCSQTSSASSKMLHGGIRYLEHLEFSLVEEALKEKNLWLKLAPHLAQKKIFTLPVYKQSRVGDFKMKLGMLLYDFLAKDLNPDHIRYSGIANLKEKFKPLKQEGLVSAFDYHDAVIDDFRLGLEVILDTKKNSNSNALNYFELQHYSQEKQYYLAQIKNNLTQETHQIKAKYIAFALGPFTNLLFDQNSNILPSKGSHLWIRKEALNISKSYVLQADGNRVIFVIPQRGAILVGTTEIVLPKAYFSPNIDQEEIDYLFEQLRHYFPEFKANQEDILASFSGIRPLVREGNESASQTSRHHAFAPLNRSSSLIMGGKYTTFRVMSQDVAKHACSYLKKSYRESSFLQELTYRSPLRSKENLSLEELIVQLIQDEKIHNKEDLKRRIGAIGEINYLHKSTSEILELYESIITNDKKSPPEFSVQS